MFGRIGARKETNRVNLLVSCLWYTRFNDICYKIFMKLNNKVVIFDEKRARLRREFKELTTDDIKELTTDDIKELTTDDIKDTTTTSGAAAAGDRDNHLPLDLKLKRTNGKQEVPPEWKREKSFGTRKRRFGRS